MKKISLLLLISVSLLLSACGPYLTYLSVDVKQPSKMQINFERPFSVIAETSDNVTDSTFLSNIGIGIAENLEKENQLEEHQIQVFSVKDTNVDLDNRNDLIYLSSQSNSELMLLLDNYKSYGFSVYQKEVDTYNAVENQIETTVLMPYKSRIRIYDVVKDTMVYQEARLDTLAWTIFGQTKIDKIKALQLIQSKIPVVCKNVGAKVIKNIVPKWKTETRYLYYYNKGLWYDAKSYAYKFQWGKAMDIWMKYAESKDIIEASCASYNMALACEMTQQYDIAIEWLDLSDSYYKLDTSNILRKILLEKKSKLKKVSFK